MSISDLKPYMSFTYGFTRHVVAEAISKRQGAGYQFTKAMYNKAGRIIANAKADGTIRTIRNGSCRYYMFADVQKGDV